MTGAGRVRIATGLALLLFVGTVAALNGLMPDKTFSESENRVLEGWPAFSLRSLLSGTFTADYERYVTDQFALRDVWIGLKTDADRALGKKDSNGVYLGADGYLIQSFVASPEAEAEARLAAIRSFHRAVPGLRKFVMLAPTAASLLRDKLPAYAPVDDERAVLRQVGQMLGELEPDIQYVDVYPALHTGREEAMMYYRTDHHWTTRGAYAAYRVLCERMGIVPQDEAAFDIREATDAFYGSLYSKSGFRHLRPDRIELYLPLGERRVQVEYVDEGRMADSLYEWDRLEQKDKYAVFLGGNHALIRITTGRDGEKGPGGGRESGGKKLLVVKDSYANSLLPFLTEHFAEIDVVDPRYYDGSLTELAAERQYDDMLVLYNVRTFMEDTFILNIAE